MTRQLFSGIRSTLDFSVNTYINYSQHSVFPVPLRLRLSSELLFLQACLLYRFRCIVPKSPELISSDGIRKYFDKYDENKNYTFINSVIWQALNDTHINPSSLCLSAYLYGVVGFLFV